MLQFSRAGWFASNQPALSIVVRCRITGLLATACAVLIGCGQAPPPPPPSPDFAAKALTDFLETWKADGSAEDLSRRTPPIRGVEPEWDAGTKLIDYEIEESGNTFGNSYSVRTRLKVRRVNARRDQLLQIIYIVSAGDPLTIVRE
ncbi:MAG: hypothetical protein R3B90_23595 [Planctomycetaceae bacterium]